MGNLLSVPYPQALQPVPMTTLGLPSSQGPFPGLWSPSLQFAETGSLEGVPDLGLGNLGSCYVSTSLPSADL